MITYLTEDDVAAILDVPIAMELLADASRKLVAGEASVAPRQRVASGGVMMNVLAAALDGRVGHKTYPVARPRGATFWFTLFGNDGRMLALIEADRLGQLRTGAASGLATDVLARPDAKIATIAGCGWQARTQLEAVCIARPLIERAYAYGRDPGRQRAFCDEMTERLQIPVEPADDLATAVAAADVVITMTNAAEPLLHGSMLREGTHINAAGSNRATSAEIDPEVVQRSAIVAVENLAQARVESGDLIHAERAGTFDWSRMVLLEDIVAGTAPARADASQITLFESLGIGLWDIAAANYVYDRAIERNMGRPVDIPG
jgi:alanine dehydrogenase